MLTATIRNLAEGTKKTNLLARENILKGKTSFQLDPATNRVMAEVDIVENEKKQEQQLTDS